MNVELVGQIGGACFAVAVEGNYAYIGEGGYLRIVDISDLSDSSVMDKVAPTSRVTANNADANAITYCAANGNPSANPAAIGNPAANGNPSANTRNDGQSPFAGYCSRRRGLGRPGLCRG